MSTEYVRSVYQCYWTFRWGIQRLFLFLRYRKLIKLLEDDGLDDDSTELKRANEKFAAAQFACQYGKFRDKCFRQLVDELEQQKIASRSDLRALIDGGDLRKQKDGNIRIKVPIITAIGGVINISFCLVGIIVYSTLIVVSPAPLATKLICLLLFNGVYFGCAYIFAYYSINPYRTLRKLKPELDEFFENWKLRNRANIKLV